MGYKKVVGLLAIGTFVEQFDSTLYLHSAVIFQGLFFPKKEPLVEQLLAASFFSFPYIIRPLTALLIGYIGDIKGRKTMIVVSMFMMAFSSLIMAFLPTYQQIGIISSIAVLGCRILQLSAALGEMIGAQLYLTECFRPPVQYLMVLLIGFASDLGGIVAFGATSLVIACGFNWRIIFIVGSFIAVVGAVLRDKFKTPFNERDYLYPSTRETRTYYPTVLSERRLTKMFKISIAYFFMLFLWPVGFYFIYLYCENILQYTFCYNEYQIIMHNFIFSLVNPCYMFLLGLFTIRVHPFKIMKVRIIIFILFLANLPDLLNQITSPHHLLLLQALSLMVWPSMRPGEPIFFKYFSILKRGRYISILFSISKSTIHVITGVSMIYLRKYFNHYGVVLLVIPILVGYTLGLYYFERLEQENGM